MFIRSLPGSPIADTCLSAARVRVATRCAPHKERGRPLTVRRRSDGWLSTVGSRTIAQEEARDEHDPSQTVAHATGGGSLAGVAGHRPRLYGGGAELRARAGASGTNMSRIPSRHVRSRLARRGL